MSTPGSSQPRACSPSKLRSFIENSNLSGHLRTFGPNRSVITQVEHHFRNMMRGIRFWELDRIQPMFTGLCMLILCKDSDTDDYCYTRDGLMARFMEFVNCVPPMIAHQLIEKLLENLAEYEVDCEAPLVKLAVNLADISCRGRVLAVCLLWWVLGRKLPSLEITMHRFRELGELAEAIRKKPPTSPSFWMADENELPLADVQANIESLRVMLVAMERLLGLLLCCDNAELLEAGYPEHFFALEDGDSTFLSEWCIDLSQELPPSMCGDRGKFGAPLHAIIGLLIQNREAKTRIETPLAVETQVQNIDASMAVETQVQDIDALMVVETQVQDIEVDVTLTDD